MPPGLLGGTAPTRPASLCGRTLSLAAGRLPLAVRRKRRQGRLLLLFRAAALCTLLPRCALACTVRRQRGCGSGCLLALLLQRQQLLPSPLSIWPGCCRAACTASWLCMLGQSRWLIAPPALQLPCRLHPLLLLLLLLLAPALRLRPQQQLRLRHTGRSGLPPLLLLVASAAGCVAAAAGQEHRPHKGPGMRLQLAAQTRRAWSVVAAGLGTGLRLAALLALGG